MRGDLRRSRRATTSERHRRRLGRRDRALAVDDERCASAAATVTSARPIDQQQLDKVRGSYSYLRPAMHAVLDTVLLRGATSADDELLATLKRLPRSRTACGQRWRSIMLEARVT